MRLMEDKIYKDRNTLKQFLSKERKKGRKIVFTNGCFDILHYGHVYYLQQAKLLGDILVVAVNSDASVRKLKGQFRPINKLRDRMMVLAALESVDCVVSFSSLTPLPLIKFLMPDVLVKGGDWKIEDIVGSKEVLAGGGRVLTIPLRKGRSTTNIVEKIRK